MELQIDSDDGPADALVRAAQVANGSTAAGPAGQLDSSEELMVYGAGDHPFAPSEDNGKIVPPPVQPAAASAAASMTDEERAAAVQQLLDADAVHCLDLRTLVFDFGPFQRLELQLRELCAELVSPEIADAVISHVRNSIHDVVVTNPQITSEERTQDGLLSRINALDEIGQEMKAADHPGGILLAKLRDLGVPDVGKLEKGINNLVQLEHDRLALLTRDLAPAGIGSTLLSGLRRMMPSPSDHLVGDARSHRNAELVTTVKGLKDIATELKTNAGNAEWERTQGVQSTREAAFLRDRIQKLTKGVEDQVDSRDLRKGLDDVNGLLDSAKTASSDEEHKSRLQELVKSMSELMKHLADALGRLFGKSDSSTASSAPRPA
jgi:hypothetical protein